MKLQITHATRYDYSPQVETAQHVAYLQPQVHAQQQLLSHTLAIEPRPMSAQASVDVFGNARHYFALQAPHRALEVVAQSVVCTAASTLPRSSLPWEQVCDLFRYQSGAPYQAASEYVFASPFVPRQSEFAAYARPSFVAGASVLAVASDLTRRIHEDFTYQSNSTQINTPALQALAQRKGVCQDFAHIMLACLRSVGLAARYVSGYLYTQAAPGTVKLRGADASHAWVAVYAPDLPDGQRWCDFDPTNNRCGWQLPGADYVTLAVGRDFSDVSPLRGVIHGGARHTLNVGVTLDCLSP